MNLHGFNVVLQIIFSPKMTFDQYELDKPSTRVPNLNADLIDKISKKLDLHFIAEKQEDKGSFSPIESDRLYLCNIT